MNRTLERPDAQKAAAAPVQVRPRGVSRGNATRDAQAEEGTSESVAEEAPKKRQNAIRVDHQTTRAIGMQHVALFVGGLVLLFVAFYVGSKYHYWRYLLATRNAPKQIATVAGKYPGVAAEDLVEQALAAEERGDWRDAAERFMGAKHKNLALRGLIFRAGTLFYDHGDRVTADRLFQNAIEIGENVDAASYYRGLVATAQRDFPSAERFLAAAVEAEPLIAHYHHSWAEALRLDGRPRQAIPRYERAIARARTEHNRAVYRFKTRVAEVEAGGATEVRKALEQAKPEGALRVDWLMTAAAVAISEGRVDEAAALIAEARSAKDPLLFAACVSDMFFRRASQTHPAIAAACRLDFDPSQPAFR